MGIDREALEAAGLVSPHGGERFVERVTFPISDKRGRIVGFGARAVADAKPKYLNSPETKIFNKRSLLYGGARRRRLHGCTHALPIWDKKRGCNFGHGDD